MVVQQMTDEGQPTRFSTQRTAADPQEIVVARLEGCRIEIADQNLTLLAAVIGDGIDQVVAQPIERGEIGNLSWTKSLRQGKFGPGPQPARKMVSFAVKGDTFGGHFRQPGLEFVQVAGARHFRIVGQTENKVAKAQMLGQ